MGQWEVRRVLVAVVVVLEGIVVQEGMVEMGGSHTCIENVAAKHWWQKHWLDPVDGGSA